MTRFSESPTPAPQRRDPDDYEPPRLEVLGTIEELTMGSFAPLMADTMITFGTISDRLLKQALEPVDAHAVLVRLAG